MARSTICWRTAAALRGDELPGRVRYVVHDAGWRRIGTGGVAVDHPLHRELLDVSRTATYKDPDLSTAELRLETVQLEIGLRAERGGRREDPVAGLEPEDVFSRGGGGHREESGPCDDRAADDFTVRFSQTRAPARLSG